MRHIHRRKSAGELQSSPALLSFFRCCRVGLSDPRRHIPQALLQRTRRVVEVLRRRGAAEAAVGRQHLHRVGGEEQRETPLQAIPLVAGRRQPCHPQRQTQRLSGDARGLPHALQDTGDGHVFAGQDIALPGGAAGRAVQHALRHIPHIHKVVAAVDGEWELPRHKRPHHGGEAAAQHITRPDEAGGKDHAGVQSLLRRLQNVGGSGRLGFCVVAPHQLRGERALLRDDRPLGLLRDGMDRAYMDQPPHAVLPAQRHDVPCPLHVDLIDPLSRTGRHGDDPRTVQHAGAFTGSIKERGQRVLCAHVPLHRVRLRRQQLGAGVAMQHQRPHPASPPHQLLHDRPAEEAGSTGHQIHIKHTLHLPKLLCADGDNPPRRPRLRLPPSSSSAQTSTIF